MPPKKGKGKKRKEPLTDEQKAKQAEQKALAEREKKIRRKRLTCEFLKLKKDKEYELLKLNENKLLDLWRPRLRKLKNEEQLEEFQAYHAAFERNLQKKDELIDALQDLLNQNDEEYDNAFDMHLHNIDSILEFYKKRLNQVRGLYSDSKQKLLNVLNEEKYRMQNYQEKSLRYLQGVMTAVNMRYREMASDSKAELFVRQEEIRNKANEETHAAQVETERRMAEIWKQFAEWLVDYDQTALPLKAEYSEIRKKDDVVVATIEGQLRKVHSFQHGFHNLTKQDKNFCLALQRYLDELNGKKDELKAAHRLQQRRFNELKKSGDENIRSLALVTRRLSDKLDDMIKKREVLLRCIERCRKNERLDEKVDPFMLRWKLEPLETLDSLSDQNTTLYFPTEVDPDGFALRPSKIDHHLLCECNPCTCEVQAEEVDQTGLNAPISKFIREYSVMERFWTRLNRVSLERRILQERKKELTNDNMQLKYALRAFMGGMNPHNQDVFTFAGELLGRAQRNYQLVVKSMMREWKRKERCRKVGGLRVH
ncbi:unnamed protein product [Orchesella dallaii]|uniref:Dynein regulatory complex subunit 2 n=1 Tax=Orchesella dallaii TaxID=48710 RepID=A0ABP1QUF0_9HEXA